MGSRNQPAIAAIAMARTMNVKQPRNRTFPAPPTNGSSSSRTRGLGTVEAEAGERGQGSLALVPWVRPVGTDDRCFVPLPRQENDVRRAGTTERGSHGGLLHGRDEGGPPRP